ncbi:MAG: outer membrane lipoprotein-sorting protein [Lentisphaerae bacterium]|nr:outer membrane lipoprotein-sorting protein [Lentisphaerota bacterium]
MRILSIGVWVGVVVLCLAGCGLASEAEAAAIESRESAAAILEACTANLPREKMTLSGVLAVRRRRGFVVSENRYELVLEWGAVPSRAMVTLYEANSTKIVERVAMTRSGRQANLTLFSGQELTPAEPPSLAGRVGGTDLTWLDLTMDYLWWRDVRLDGVGRAKGRECDIIVATPPSPIPGCAGVRLWIDKKLGFLMQAEQLDPQGEPVRRMWVQSVKKMSERWMIRDMEVEMMGSGHRTRLYVEHLILS